jgi:hypothetical protein
MLNDGKNIKNEKFDRKPQTHPVNPNFDCGYPKGKKNWLVAWKNGGLAFEALMWNERVEQGARIVEDQCHPT